MTQTQQVNNGIDVPDFYAYAAAPLAAVEHHGDLFTSAGVMVNGCTAIGSGCAKMLWASGVLTLQPVKGYWILRICLTL